MSKKTTPLFFVVEDDRIFQEMIVYHLQAMIPDCSVESFCTGEECVVNLQKGPQLVILDIQLMGATGLEILNAIKTTRPDIHVIIVSHTDNINTAVQAMKMGAYDYLKKDDDVLDKIVDRVKLLASLYEITAMKKRRFALLN